MKLFDFRRRRLVKQTKAAIERLLAQTVEQFMTDYVVTVSPSKTIMDAAMLMIGEDISTLIVATDERPIGVLTERDFITKDLQKQPDERSINEVMSEQVFTVQRDTSVLDTVLTMEKHHIRKLVVLNEDQSIAGIVTQTDICRVLHKEVRFLTDEVPPLYVRDVMTTGIISVSPSTTLATAKKRMHKHSISALPVEKGEEYTGLFTEYDIVMRFYNDAGKSKSVKVEDLMQSPIKCIPSDVTIFDANLIMLFENIRRLLAVRKGEVVGIVTQTDIVHAAIEYLQRTKDYLTAHADTVAYESFTILKDSTHIVSEYEAEHLRLFTVKQG